jgi:hypothetical protein
MSSAARRLRNFRLPPSPRLRWPRKAEATELVRRADATEPAMRPHGFRLEAEVSRLAIRGFATGVSESFMPCSVAPRERAQTIGQWAHTRLALEHQLRPCRVAQADLRPLAEAVLVHASTSCSLQAWSIIDAGIS